jgi:hypothetical protein
MAMQRRQGAILVMRVCIEGNPFIGICTRHPQLGARGQLIVLGRLGVAGYAETARPRNDQRLLIGVQPRRKRVHLMSLLPAAKSLGEAAKRNTTYKSKQS